jgi:hypothetical protein
LLSAWIIHADQYRKTLLLNGTTPFTFEPHDAVSWIYSSNLDEMIASLYNAA